MGLIAKVDLRPGSKITDKEIGFAWPSKGVGAEFWSVAEGCRLTRSIKKGNRYIGVTFELKIRPPANNTLGQLSVKYKKTPLSLFTELSRAFPEIDWSTRDLFHIFNNHRLPFGHLIITDRIYNTKTHFFKSVEPEFLCDQKLANELARFAAQYCNYIVNPCTPPKTLEWEGIAFCIEYSLWENLGEIPLDPNYFMNIGKDFSVFS